jgi:hypothetical protein
MWTAGPNGVNQETATSPRTNCSMVKKVVVDSPAALGRYSQREAALSHPETYTVATMLVVVFLLDCIVFPKNLLTTALP